MGFEQNVEVICNRVAVKYSCNDLQQLLKTSLIARKATLSKLVEQIHTGELSPKRFEPMIEAQKSLIVKDLEVIKPKHYKINAIANMAVYELAKNRA